MFSVLLLGVSGLVPMMAPLLIAFLPMVLPISFYFFA
jgi:hypothetical protein